MPWIARALVESQSTNNEKQEAALIYGTLEPTGKQEKVYDSFQKLSYLPYW